MIYHIKHPSLSYGIIYDSSTMMWRYDDCDLDTVIKLALSIKQLSSPDKTYRVLLKYLLPRSYLLIKLLFDVYGIHMSFVGEGFVDAGYEYCDVVMDDESYTKFMLVFGNSNK
jgi:hypothetical protein